MYLIINLCTQEKKKKNFLGLQEFHNFKSIGCLLIKCQVVDCTDYYYTIGVDLRVVIRECCLNLTLKIEA